MYVRMSSCTVNTESDVMKKNETRHTASVKIHREISDFFIISHPVNYDSKKTGTEPVPVRN